MVSQAVIDFDAITAEITKTEERAPVKIGGRTFSVSTIPAAVSLFFTKAELAKVSGESYGYADAMLDGCLAILSAGSSTGEPVTRIWFEQNVSGIVAGQLIDYVLDDYLKNRRTPLENLMNGS